MGIPQIFGPKYPISVRKLYGCINIIFEDLREDVTLICKEAKNSPRPLLINFLNKRRNNLTSLDYMCQIVFHFHPSHPKPKALASSIDHCSNIGFIPFPGASCFSE